MSQTNWEADKIVTIKAPPGKYPVCNTATFALDGLFLDVVKFDVMLLFGELPWLDVYIYDYLVKRDLKATAQAFQAEGKVSSDPVAIDAPGGFLFEWWSVFWDIFIARTNEKHSEVAASYIEVPFFVLHLCKAVVSDIKVS
ncbi:hypothetical protein HID58_013107 [Brassica napus]|uniref:LisH domain-containing protein n=1 Tax=Brassica napus TaxID=3708 RepID=A0ABQ8E2Z3_BRANA|nr:hypothetical protein HID58_013107 [Brassica napus]